MMAGLIVWAAIQVTYIGLLTVVLIRVVQQRRQLDRIAKHADLLLSLHRFQSDLLAIWARQWGAPPDAVKAELSEILRLHQMSAHSSELGKA